MRKIYSNQPAFLNGGVSSSIVMMISLGVCLVSSMAVLIWGTTKYFNLKQNFNMRVEERETAAKIALTQKLEAEFAEREKEPYYEFTGPDDLGRVHLFYPKTWSVLINKDSVPYEAIFNPMLIRPINSDSRYALRLTIENKDYTKALAAYDSLIKKGYLEQSIITVDGEQAARLDGKFSEKITGAAVLFKVRDKTVTLRTDIATDEYLKQFNTIIEKVTFNK
ncbi:MAG: hypothetical protein Q3996_01715 [Candidatus Saccharibacteria bacterium]|nr:hypothetical protein [Candidatus Saccharibacteria bacterium]